MSLESDGETAAQNMVSEIKMSAQKLRERALELSIEYHRGADSTVELVEAAAKRFVAFLESLAAPIKFVCPSCGHEPDAPKVVSGTVQPMTADQLKGTP